MSHAVTFENFDVYGHTVFEIGETEQRSGVVVEIGKAFQHSPDDLEGLIGAVAPHKTLQDNIAHITDVLSDPATRVRIGYGDAPDAAAVAHDWGVRSGLQNKVLRPLMVPRGASTEPPRFDMAIFPGRVVNWMNRMGDVVEEVASDYPVDKLVLAAANRRIGAAENPAVPAGTPEARYMQQYLVPQLGHTGLFRTTALLPCEKADGPAVMAMAATHAHEVLDLTTAHILVPSVAGNWMQAGVQARTALRELDWHFDADPDTNPQLWVASDAFPLGKTGEEPKTTHQNPFSAVGNILRGAALLEGQQSG